MLMLDHFLKMLSTHEATQSKFKISSSRKADKKTLQIYFLMAAIAVHFSNYFYSGIVKMGHFVDLIDGIHFWTWTVENPTYVLINNAWYSGNLPIAGFPKLTQHVFDFMKAVAIPANFIVISTQIICIICLFKITWTKFITIFYDLLHLTIFITTGIFFWKWIILNTAIATALFSVRKVKIPKMVVLFLMLVVLFSPFVFNIVKLGWLDTRANNIAYLLVIDKAGREYRVPSNYFGALSITFAQQRIGRPFEGFFKTGTFGNSYDYDVFLESNSCQSIQLESSKKALTREEVETLSSFISRHHRYIIENVNEKGHFLYDAFPHHIWTNPWLYQDFYQLDKRDIIEYKYVVEAACVYETPSGNKPFTADIKRREVYDIPFKQQQNI
jgi:hypothetical protein